MGSCNVEASLHDLERMLRFDLRNEGFAGFDSPCSWLGDLDGAVDG